MKHKVFRSIIALMLVIGLVAVQTPSSVLAATLTVTNNNDSGPGSLRQAILDASSGDTIDFDADYTITLSSQLPIIDKELTINGNGAANTIIEASTCNPVTLPGGCTPATYRVFEVNASGNLTLDSLTVRHGNCEIFACNTSNYGSGIYNAGTVAIANSAIISNNSPQTGAGIYNESFPLSIVTITNSILADNYASFGGGGFAGAGQLTITDSIFSNNTGRNGSGGIDCTYCSLDIANSTFSGNISTERNGGAISTSGPTSIENSIFHANSAGSGGAIYTDLFVTLNITSSTFSENIAFTGGAIWSNDYGSINITNSTFSSNIARIWGGGVLNNNSEYTIHNTNFIGNSSEYYEGGFTHGGGGGIANLGTMSITDSTFSENSASNEGSGIFNFYTLLTVTNSTFISNSAVIAGGGIFNMEGTITVSKSTFTSNDAEGGGGIYNSVQPSTLAVANSTFSENSSIFGGGGISNIGTLTVANSTFSGNDGGFGGGGAIVNLSTLHLMNSILANSTSGEDCYNASGDVIGTNINNLIETNGPSGNMCGTSALSADPMLGPLADNGGATQTMALLAGSPAIDAGDNAICETTDQRGVTRPQGAVCDIGAFELEVTNPTIKMSIDIKPGSEINTINPNSRGKIPVAILSTSEFDAPSKVDVTSLTFGRFGEEVSLAFCNENGEDINGDGTLDLVCHFHIQTAGFQAGDNEGILMGESTDGLPLKGKDLVTVIN